jgi:hypothetical protein
VIGGIDSDLDCAWTSNVRGKHADAHSLAVNLVCHVVTQLGLGILITRIWGLSVERKFDFFQNL